MYPPGGQHLRSRRSTSMLSCWSSMIVTASVLQGSSATHDSDSSDVGDSSIRKRRGQSEGRVSATKGACKTTVQLLVQSVAADLNQVGTAELKQERSSLPRLQRKCVKVARQRQHSLRASMLCLRINPPMCTHDRYTRVPSAASRDICVYHTTTMLVFMSCFWCKQRSGPIEGHIPRPNINILQTLT